MLCSTWTGGKQQSLRENPVFQPGAMMYPCGGINLTSNKPTTGAQFKIRCGIEDESSI